MKADLVHGAAYRAVLRVPFAAWLDDSIVTDTLAAHDITDVRLYAKPEDLPADWPADMRQGFTASFPDYIVYAEGTYDGPDATVDLPDQIVQLREKNPQAAEPAGPPAPAPPPAPGPPSPAPAGRKDVPPEKSAQPNPYVVAAVTTGSALVIAVVGAWLSARWTAAEEERRRREAEAA